MRERFNPCIFLGQYLMRNNPNKDDSIKLEYHDMFQKFARIEKIKRFFTFRRQKIFKHFTLMPYHANFCRKDINAYITALDSYLEMEGKLAAHFKAEDHWPTTDASEQIGFDQFFEIFSKWGINQTSLNYEDFAPNEVSGAAKAENLKKQNEKFK